MYKQIVQIFYDYLVGNVSSNKATENKIVQIDLGDFLCRVWSS